MSESHDGLTMAHKTSEDKESQLEVYLCEDTDADSDFEVEELS